MIHAEPPFVVLAQEGKRRRLCSVQGEPCHAVMPVSFSRKLKFEKFVGAKKPDVDSWTEVKRRKPSSTKTDASNKVRM